MARVRWRPRAERLATEIAAVDAYATAVSAVVAEVVSDGVVLDRTVFYPRGGGQPGDTGVLSPVGGRGAVLVTDTVKRDGRIVHMVDDSAQALLPLSVGSSVEASIDWERRHLLMRTHTALHALSGIVFRDYGAKVTGGNMEPGVARMDFELDSLPAGFGEEIGAKLNAALAEDHEVRVLFLPRAEALSDPDLIRTKVNLIPESVDPIRIIDIVGLDRQADGGTHVRSTAEVGTVWVVKTENKGKTFKRMRIELAS
jgi:misacylated tRNA(Ala) deacylase